jgi:hypothetical protein
MSSHQTANQKQMRAMKMKIEQSFYGKQAISEFELGNGLILEVLTMKRYGGNVATTFQVWKKISETSRQTAFDFKTRFIDHGKVRLTEKKLVELHNSAITNKNFLAENFIVVEQAKFKSSPCAKVLKLMDSDHNYQDALSTVLSETPSLDKQSLEAELNNYI